MRFDENPIWHSISSYPLNEPNLISTFPNRLSSNFNWSDSYTESVIQEYRKFLFLCATRSRKFVPPYPVAMAWETHQHFYPLSWKSLRENVIGKQLRISTIADDDSWEDLLEPYEQTRCAYIESFGQHPPIEIWPGSEEWFHEDLQWTVHFSDLKTITISLKWIIFLSFPIAAFAKYISPNNYYVSFFLVLAIASAFWLRFRRHNSILRRSNMFWNGK